MVRIPWECLNLHETFKIACHHGGLSHFGGAYFFHEFVRVLHIRHFHARQIRYLRHNQDYSISQMLLALVYLIVLGLDRIETASLLRADGTKTQTKESNDENLAGIKS